VKNLASLKFKLIRADGPHVSYFDFDTLEALVEKVAELEATAPVPAEPVPAEPAPTAPVPAEPVPAEPAPTAPVPAEPVPAEPAPTAPVPEPAGEDGEKKEELESEVKPPTEEPTE